MSAQEAKSSIPLRGGEFCIVGVGASAGGLEALERFFASMPTDTGLAFVVVQHLSPDFESMMDELLAQHTRIPIHRAQNGMRLEPNAIYLLPPKKEMVVSSGRLLLTDKDPHKGLALPIDQFFVSLAQDAGSRAVGVVLSGTGSDGSRGIRAIHAAGGLVVAQTEESAKFDGMPRSARDTGVVDLFLAPEQMSEALLHFVGNPQHRDADSDDSSESWNANEQGIHAIYTLLRREYGIDFSHYKPATVERRIERRLSLNQSLDLDEYVERLRDDAGELNSLYRDLLIGVTCFFRDPSAFERLGQEIRERLLGDLKRGRELRVWVAGCATGEEAYSIAILLHEQLEAAGKDAPFKVFATDVHRASLDFAGAGIYRDESLAELSPERRARYFHRQGDGYQVHPELRQRIVFAPHNIIKDAPFTKLDLVTCRNLLIYLQPLAQKKALSLFHFGLRAGGLLFLGPSENPADLEVEFACHDEHWKIYRKRRDIRLPVDVRLPATAPTLMTRRFEPLPPPSRYGHGSDSHLFGAYDALLDEFLPPSVLINEDRQVLHAFAGAEQFLRLKAGRPSSDILELVETDLRMALAGGIRRATKERARVDLTGVMVQSSEGPRRMTVGVRPVHNQASHALCLLVTFDDLGPAARIDIDTAAFDNAQLSREQMLALECELRYTKENLQATVEELEASNEELQATNEELVAANEELQSTNEELHSVNEELYTVNAEYQRKIAELMELTDDIDNLLASTEVGVIFLDRNLCIRKFTPRIAATFNLLPQDLGRRIDTFSNTIDDSDLLSEVNSVLETERVIEREVRDRAGNWFFLRILPYHSRSSVEGVVLTLIDISVLKKTEDELDEKDRELQGILDNSTAMIFVKDLDGRYLLANRHCRTKFGPHTDGLLGKTDHDLLPPETADAIRANDVEVLKRGEVFEFEEVVPGPNGPRTLLAIKFPLRNRQDEVYAVGGICTDISRQKRAEQHQRQEVDRRDQFLAMLSHELRNPLGAILNATYLLEQDVEGRMADEAREVIGRQSRHMARLLDDLLDVSRITQNKIAIRKHVIDLRDTVADALHAIGPVVDARAQELAVELPDEPLYVEGDPARLQQIQVNLLNNAAKYTPPGERISLSLTHDGTNAIITVRDTGIGIPPDMLEGIFDLFVQANDVQEQDMGGMGVGLTLVRSLVELHGGTVVAESEGLGKGSEFRVTLPIAKKRRRSARMSPDHSAPMQAEVLIIEDNEDSREMLQALLELHGLQVRTASDGIAGLAAIEEEPPDVALVDIGLPGLDGYEVARRVRRDLGDSQTMLIALTGFGQRADREAAIRAGFDEHLIKPLQFDELRRIFAKRFSRA